MVYCNGVTRRCVFVVQLLDRLLDQLVRSRSDAVGRLAVDAAPQGLELLLVEVGVERVLLGAAVVADLGQLLASLKTLSISWNTCSASGCKLVGKVANVPAFLGLVVLLGDVALLVHVAVLDQIELDVSSLISSGDRDRPAGGQHLAGEVGLVGHLRPGRQRVADVLLQRRTKSL
jgi:hypothetical protein